MKRTDALVKAVEAIDKGMGVTEAKAAYAIPQHLHYLLEKYLHPRRKHNSGINAVNKEEIFASAFEDYFYRHHVKATIAERHSITVRTLQNIFEENGISTLDISELLEVPVISSSNVPVRMLMQHTKGPILFTVKANPWYILRPIQEDPLFKEIT